MMDKLSGCLILLEEIDEGGDTLEGCLAGLLDVDGEADAHADGATQVGEGLHVGAESHALSGEHGLAELHLVHAVVDEALQVVDLYDLIPEVGQERECEVSVDDGLMERALCLAALLIDVYPLVVEGGIGKHINAVLIDLQVVAGAYFLSKIFLEIFVTVDDNGAHIRMMMTNVTL